MSYPKRYFFDTAAFQIDEDVDAYIRQKGAIALDLGSSLYIASEKAALMFTELARRIPEPPRRPDDAGDRSSQMLSECQLENRKLSDEMATLKAQLKTVSSNFQSAKVSLEEASEVISSLKSENMLLRSSQPKATEAQAKPEKIPSQELAALRSQHADAIASLKVLEEENNELRKELEIARNAGPGQVRLAASP